MDNGLGSGSCGFRKLIDEEIVFHARHGDAMATEYLLSKYKGLVEGKARSYFLAGADHEDVVQEGMIGLFKAIRDYRTGRLAGFRAFAEVCVTRQIITAVKSASRQKHLPLNRCISLANSEGDNGLALIEVLADSDAADPEKSVIESEIRRCAEQGAVSGLSCLERKVFSCYMQGMSYQEIATLLSRGSKSVDNALQRAKRKIGEKLQDIDADVAQWQSNGFVNRRLRVRLPSSAPFQ